MEVLSQSQIDDLLNSLTTGEMDIDTVQDEATKKVKEYDFRSPKRFTKEQLKIISSVYENYSRLLSSYLTGMLRLYVNVECVHIEEQRYSEFSNAQPDSVLLAIGELRFSGSNEENNTLIMDFAKPVAFAIIERLLGGTGDGLSTTDKEFTEIEMALMDSLFKGAFPQMTDSWANYLEVDALYRKLETNSRLMQAIGADETVVILMLDCSIKDVTGTITICVPAVCMEDALKKIDSQQMRNLKRINSAGDKERRELVMQYLSESDLELRCVIGNTQVTLGDVMYLNVGDVLQLDKPMGSLVDLSVGESPWFQGKIGVQRNKKAFQVIEVL